MMANMALIIVIILATAITYLIEVVGKTHMPKIGALPPGFHLSQAYALSMDDLSSLVTTVTAIITFRVPGFDDVSRHGAK
jgi:formate hydrogenlyase subunit 3/multisubunit Na+/H+ antiporter MnhD subunit